VNAFCCMWVFLCVCVCVCMRAHVSAGGPISVRVSERVGVYKRMLMFMGARS